MSEPSLSGNLEELVLTALCHNTDLASAIILRITPELFTTRHFRTIAKAAMDHVIRYAEAPKNHLSDILESEINKGETGTTLWKQIGRMEDLAAQLQPEYVLTELNNFVSIHKLRLKITDAMDLLHKGDWVKAQEALHAVNLDAGMTPGIWMNEPDKALSFLDKNEDEDDFRLGIEALDSRGIKPARKTLLVVMAPKKRGKSMCLIGIGKQTAYLDRKKVLHITLEMSEEQVAKRYVQSICACTSTEAAERNLRVPLFKRDELGNFHSIEFDNISALSLNQRGRKEIANKLQYASHGRRLLIKEFPTGTLTTNHLRMYLEYLKRTEKFEPDMVILDYGNLMDIKGRDMRMAIGQMWRELRGIAVERNLAMISATQGNRESENAKVVGAVHVAEDWSVFGTADTVITICQTPEEKSRRLARLYVAAARDAADQFLVQISQSYETCIFARDSIYMSKADFDRMMRDDDD